MNCSTRELGAPPAPGAEPVPGIRLVRRIGVGGSGEVWKAEGAGGFPVAVKIILLSGARSAAHLRGLDIARTVRHPNLLANFGAWADDERLILAMELADGSLWDRFLEARDRGLRGIPRDELIDALAEAARGVDYLNDPRHERDGRGGLGVQHRDLKPQNILLVGGGVKVADFGAARWMEDEVTSHTGLQWTPAYAAPEFFLGATSRNSDQYSLAVTYCHLRTGRLPFTGDPGYVMAGHLMREPDLTMLDEPERAAVARALSKRPEARWPSCRAFVEALRTAAVPVSVPVPAPAPRAVARACLVWPEHIASTLAEAAPALTYATADAAPHDDADDSVWDDAPPSGYDTIDGPGAAAFAPIPDDEDGFPSTPAFGRRQGVAIAAFLLMGGLALWASGLVRTAPRRPGHRPAPPALAFRRPAAAPIRERASAVPELRRVALRPAAPGPAAALVRAEAAAAPKSAGAARGIAPALGRTLARLVLPLIANPTVPRRFAVLAASEATPPTEGEAVVEPPRPEVAPRIDPASFAPCEAHGADADEHPAAPAVDEPSPTEAAETARRRADEHLARGELDAALAGYGEAIRLDPENAAAYAARGEALVRWGDHGRAIADFDAALRLRPDSAPTLNDRGLASLGTGDVFRAIADLDAALRVAPGSAVIHYNRGIAYARLGDPVEARAAFDAALRINPSLAIARTARDRVTARPVSLTRGASRPRRAAPATPSSPIPGGTGFLPTPQDPR